MKLCEIRDQVSAISAVRKRQLPKMNTYILTDCKSLWDAVQKVAPQLHERRTLLDVISLKESISPGGLLWIPTHEQWSDSLTKICRVLSTRLLHWMGDPAIALRSTAE